MKIFLNGKICNTESQTLSELLLENNILANRVAIEVDLVVVPRSQYEVFILRENSKIEIITFVGGG